jgi:4-hydroxy-tetrahydrodipicolinate reductase
MPIKILVNGYQGKMGQAALKAIQNASDLEFVAGCDRHDNLNHIIKESGADVVLDLTVASSAFSNTETIINAGAHPVIGTSGLTPVQIELLQQRCREKKLGGIIAPNFSVGAILMMHFAAQAAGYFNEVEIIEMHHAQKQDAPSGTARKTAELIKAVHAKGSEVPIHSVRLSGIVAEQSVIFGAPGETLSIRHSSIDRSCFMPGILLACRKVIELNHLLYGLDSLIINS